MSVFRLDGLRGGAGGGDLGDLVSADPFATRAALDATSAENGKLALLETPTSGEPRLFVRSGGAWVAAGGRAWEVATTGAGVMTGLIDAAGAAVYPGDLGVDGNGTIYYAVGSAGRCVFVPRSLTGGVILGETHTPTLRARWYSEDPATADDVSGIGTPVGTVSYDAETGLTTIVNQASVQVGPGSMIPSTVDGWIVGVTDAQLTQGTRSGGQDAFFAAVVTDGAGSEDFRALVNGSAANYSGASNTDPTVLHDASIAFDIPSGRLHYNNPAPSSDFAVPVTAQTLSAGSYASRTWSLIIQVLSDASDPTYVLRGAYVVTWEAV